MLGYIQNGVATVSGPGINHLESKVLNEIISNLSFPYQEIENEQACKLFQ